MAIDARSLLSQQLEAAHRMVREALDGMTEAEFWWEPAPGCWTVRRQANGRWAADYAEPDPVPAPLSTIAWRLVHIGECKIMYHEYAFGPGRLTWPEIDSAHTVEGAIEQVEHGHALLSEALEGLTDDDLDRPRATNWGEQWPTWKIFWTMIHHDIHHGAEIGTLRDLFRVARGVAASGAPS